MSKVPAWLARSLTPPGERIAGCGLLLLRVYVGSALLLAHALPKMQELTDGSPGFVGLVASLGFPAPSLFAWLAMLAQVLGSLGVVVGALTRVAAGAVLSTLAIGVVGVHLRDGFFVLEPGLAYIAALATLALLGPGRYSIDALLDDRYRHRTPQDAT